jgi:hypothetical protein
VWISGGLTGSRGIIQKSKDWILYGFLTISIFWTAKEKEKDPLPFPDMLVREVTDIRLDFPEIRIPHGIL